MWKPVPSIAAWLAGALACGLVGCSGPDALPPLPEPACAPLERSAPPAARNLVLVLSDTLRRDRLAPYGGPANTPRLAAFARGGQIFTAAESQAPWTKPSIASLFTGLLPSQHGVVSHPTIRNLRAGRGRGGPDAPLESDVLAEELSTLAERLSAAGYETAAFVSNPWLQRELGFAQGFARYEDGFAANATPGTVVTEAGLAWLRERADPERPYFLYLHYMDAHAPYPEIPAEAYAAREQEIAADARRVGPATARAIGKLAVGPGRASLVEQGAPAKLALLELAYDTGVAQFDRAFGALLDGFASLGGLEDTALILTSDHGEALFERGWGSHGNGLFEDETGVPLVARLPGVAPAAVSCPAALVDLQPTLCDYLGIPCEATGGPGVSFFSEAFADPGRLVEIEGVIGKPENRAVRDARFKLLSEPHGRKVGRTPAGGRSLFDLERDPGEQDDLLAAPVRPADAEAALRRLRARAEERAAAEPGEAPGRTTLDAATQERLRALGYLE